MDSYLRQSNATKAPEDLIELTSEDRFTNIERNEDFNMDQMPDQSLDLNFGEDKDKDFINKIFSNSLNLNDEYKDDEVMIDVENTAGTNSKVDLSGVKRKAKKDTTEKEAKVKNFKEPKPKSKVRMSDKERARKSRQRKKKYYEDLENKVGYLEELCK